MERRFFWQSHRREFTAETLQRLDDSGLPQLILNHITCSFGKSSKDGQKARTVTPYVGIKFLAQR